MAIQLGGVEQKSLIDRWGEKGTQPSWPPGTRLGDLASIEFFGAVLAHVGEFIQYLTKVSRPLTFLLHATM